MPFADMTIELPCEGLDATSEPHALYQAGLAYSLGEAVATDLVAAHKWFNLAAAKGVEEAKTLRQEMADQMSETEIREAQKAAREWLKLMN
ncbi:MAG: hypothetical protein AAF253_06205 [Pseudomonadota bacterium]